MRLLGLLLAVSSIIAVIGLAAGCSVPVPEGEEGGACLPDSVCDEGLTCSVGVQDCGLGPPFLPCDGVRECRRCACIIDGILCGKSETECEAVDGE